ncbi:MAG: type II toxin-antitoxin system RelB/DinJ family antitoxin [Magnetococcus sp. DMHC-1]
MAKTEMIHARVEPETKQAAEEIFRTLGISASEAINMFYRQVALQHAMPYEINTPNAETLEALRQAHAGENLTTWGSVDELIQSAGRQKPFGQPRCLTETSNVQESVARTSTS